MLKKSKSDAIPSKFKIYLCKYLKFGMIFSPKFLEFSLVFSIFLFFVNFQKIQNFNSNPESSKIKNMNSISDISKKPKCAFSKIYLCKYVL
jgi:uncharacterized membrane protein